ASAWLASPALMSSLATPGSSTSASQSWPVSDRPASGAQDRAGGCQPPPDAPDISWPIRWYMFPDPANGPSGPVPANRAGIACRYDGPEAVPSLITLPRMYCDVRLFPGGGPPGAAAGPARRPG